MTARRRLAPASAMELSAELLAEMRHSLATDPTRAEEIRGRVLRMLHAMKDTTSVAPADAPQPSPGPAAAEA